MDQQKVTLDISGRAIAKVLATIFGIWLVYQTRDIVLLLFLVLIIVMSLSPIVERWQKHMPRAVAVGLLFVIIIAVLSIVISLLMPPLISQIGELANNLPGYAQKIQTVSHSLQQPNESLALTQNILQGISQQLTNLSRNLISTTLGIIGGLISFFTVIVLSVYLLLDKTGIKNFIVSLLPPQHKHDVYTAITKIGDKLGAWLRGQLVLMLIIGLATVVWATVLGLPYALTLGLWAGLTEIIPFLGPIIGGIPFVLIAFQFSPLKALIALLLLIATQQAESNFLVPKIMEKSVGLSPVIVIVALLIGSKLFGITGAILSVPVAATLMVIIQEWPRLFRSKS